MGAAVWDTTPEAFTVRVNWLEMHHVRLSLTYIDVHPLIPNTMAVITATVTMI
jgi:phosphate-selective porin